MIGSGNRLAPTVETAAIYRYLMIGSGNRLAAIEATAGMLRDLIIGSGRKLPATVTQRQLSATLPDV